jgi:hypothetical protein
VRLRPTLFTLTLGLVGMGLLLAWSPLRAELFELGRLLLAGNLPGVRDHLRGFGPWAPVVPAAELEG